jgi:hypothetical protein
MTWTPALPDRETIPEDERAAYGGRRGGELSR